MRDCRIWRGAVQAGVLAFCAMIFAIAPAGAQDGVSDNSAVDRAKAQSIIGNLRKITSDNGIDELKAVEIGGSEQWISVRGRDRDNPILLFIHGGPAVPEMPASWFYQSPWEDYFTVVQWDQRGAGKSYASVQPDGQGDNLDIDRFVCDAEQLVAYLRETYGKRKIFVLGHSWGTIIGLRLAKRHPDWLHAYIGMGQVIDFMENERLGTEFSLHAAEQQGNDEALAELRSILPYPEPDKPLAVQKILIQRKWLTYFGGMAWNRRDFTFQEDAALLSPDYTLADIDKSKELAGLTVMAVLPEVAKSTLDEITALDCPVFIFAGEHDYATSSELAVKWFDGLDAPQKRLFMFEGVAHEIQFEAPGKLFYHLVTDVRPLAVAAGDGKPAS